MYIHLSIHILNCDCQKNVGQQAHKFHVGYHHDAEKSFHGSKNVKLKFKQIFHSIPPYPPTKHLFQCRYEKERREDARFQMRTWYVKRIQRLIRLIERNKLWTEERNSLGCSPKQKYNVCLYCGDIIILYFKVSLS